MKRKILSAQLVLLCLLVSLPLISEAQEFCWKDSYARGAGTVPPLATRKIRTDGSCPSGFHSVGFFCAKQYCKNGKTADGGLCYKPCKEGYEGVGPVCWTPAPEAWLECGMGAAKNQEICNSVTQNQVVSTLKLASGVYSSATANQADSARVAQLKEELADTIALYNKYVAPVVKVGSKGKAVAGILDESGKVADQPVVTAEDIIRVSAQIMALADPTGVSSAVAAYLYPTCDKYFPGRRSLLSDGGMPTYKWGQLMRYDPANTALPSGVFSVYNAAENKLIGVCQAERPYDTDPILYHPGKLHDGKCHVPYGQSGNYRADEYRPLMAELPALSWKPYSLDAHNKGTPLPALTLWSNHYRAPMHARLPVCRAMYNGGWHPGKLLAGTCRVAYGNSKYEAENYDVLTRNTELWGYVHNGGDAPNAFYAGIENGDGLGICRAEHLQSATWHPGKLHRNQCKYPYGSRSYVSNTFQYLMEDNKDLIWVKSSHALSKGGQLQPPGALIASHEGDRPLRICRAAYNGVWHPGKIYAGSCDVAFGSGTKRTFREYEVLIINRMPEGFAECAKEHSTCFFNGTVSVWYGDIVTNRWKVAEQTERFVCNSETFGGDPASGIGKACYIPENAIPVLPPSYMQCAPRAGFCDLSQSADVLYGAGENFIMKTLDSRFFCDDSTFGGDPAPGQHKSCYFPSERKRFSLFNRNPLLMTQCAPLGGTCRVPGDSEVYFGTTLGWRVKQIASETVCSKEVFGDPGPAMRGESYRCMVKHNVALGKPVMQSSEEFGGAAQRAVDGSADGLFANHSVTHTSYGPGRQEYLEIDLQADHTVHAMAIFNRLDACCKDRIAGARVDLFKGGQYYKDADRSTRSAASGFMGSYDIAQAEDVIEIRFAAAQRGVRYVRIYGPVGGVVSVAELEVYGAGQIGLLR